MEGARWRLELKKNKTSQFVILRKDKTAEASALGSALAGAVPIHVQVAGPIDLWGAHGGAVCPWRSRNFMAVTSLASQHAGSVTCEENHVRVTHNPNLATW